MCLYTLDRWGEMYNELFSILYAIFLNDFFFQFQIYFHNSIFFRCIYTTSSPASQQQHARGVCRAHRMANIFAYNGGTLCIHILFCCCSCYCCRPLWSSIIPLGNLFKWTFFCSTYIHTVMCIHDEIIDIHAMAT